jgi:glutathione S-transferase
LKKAILVSIFWGLSRHSFAGAVCMTESAAIWQYLAASSSGSPLDVASGESGFADYLNYLHFGEATLTSLKL